MPLSFGAAQAKTWRIAGPIMLSNISTPLVGIVDAAVIGHLPDYRLLAAVNLGAASISLLFFLFVFLRMGTSGLVAQAYGAGDHTGLQVTFKRALAIAFTLGLLLALLQQPIISISGTLANASASMDLLDDYLSYRLSAAPFALMAMVTTAVLVAVERAGTAVAIQIFANLLNMALDYTFVYQLHMAVDGVALASAIAESSACLIGLWTLKHLLRRPENLTAEASNNHGWLKLLTVNRDIFIRSALLVSVFYSLTAISGQYGNLALAGCGVLLNLFYLCSYGLDGFAHAAEVLAGHAYGARSPSDLRQYVRASSLWAALFAAAMSLGLWLAGEQLIALQSNIPAVQEFANAYLLWFVFMPLLGVAAFMMDGIFIGTTHSVDMRNGMLLSTAVYLLALPAMALWDLHGLWLAFSTFMVARGVILTLFYPRIKRGLASA